MSFYDLAMVWRHSPATGNALLVHLTLADMAIDGLVCASQGEIAILARCDVSTVSRRIADLIEIGELVEESRGAGRRTPIFRITHKAMAEGAPRVVVQNAGIVHNAVINPVEDQQAEQERYCEMVKAGHWPDYQGTYRRECLPPKSEPR